MWKIRSLWWSLILLALVSTLGSAQDALPPRYTLQPLPGNATAISNTGWVVGSIVDPDGLSHAYRWRAGRLEMLNDFGRGSRALAVNDAGEVVGTAAAPLAMPVFSGISAAVVFTRDTPEILGAVSGPEGLATEINNRRQIVGTGFHDNLLFEAFIWQDGQIQALARQAGLDGVSQALGINEIGQVVGWSRPAISRADQGPRAMLWSNGAAHSLTTPGTVTSTALDINDTGGAVGWVAPPSDWAGPNGPFTPVVWDTARGTGPTPLAPGVQGIATALNSAGIAVGNGTSGWALLFADGQAFRLQPLVMNTNGWRITTAQDINDAGQILVGAVRNKVAGSFLLTPTVGRYTAGEAR